LKVLLFKVRLELDVGKSLLYKFNFSFSVVYMRIRRKIGQKGQIVIPKVIREYAGIRAGDEVVMEVREGEVIIRSGVDPKEFVESFCSVPGKKLTKKIDLEGLLEQEVEERFALR